MQRVPSGVEFRPIGFGKASMKSLPVTSMKSFIIGVSVGPGLRQLRRIPVAGVRLAARRSV